MVSFSNWYGFDYLSVTDALRTRLNTMVALRVECIHNEDAKARSWKSYVRPAETKGSYFTLLVLGDLQILHLNIFLRKSASSF